MSHLEELKQDCDELRAFIAESSRARVKEVLQRELIKLEQEVSLLSREKPASTDQPNATAEEKPSSSKPVTVSSYTKKITSYGWDQSDKFVKIYITLPEVETVPKESLVPNFGDRSVEVTVKGLKGVNYQLQICRLYSSIVPSTSYLKAKSGTLTVFLKKEKMGEKWEDVVYKEKKDFKPPGLDESKDPSEGIMDLMKKMYDEGDDEMKKTITKAWMESREKQASGIM
ncbi:calcyclin-binding protein [Nematostella vectensis]|uniref:calcyclin-binding protein n=1 Tax=Nematostella vectensis TaxID=45351 RepID=UPI0020773C0B|nr:calcyclin-binding protein [Nematostella vectensis]